MRGYDTTGLHQKDEKGYEQADYDEYEEEASEPEEEDEPEPPKPTKEEQEFLKLREQLKEKFRQELKKQNTSAFGHSTQSLDKKKAVAYDKFGSFFGPSQPVIAPRVIEESRSIRENPHIVAKVSSSSGYKRDPTSSEMKRIVHRQQPKVVNEIKNKAQTLKDMRDYSFLLSDDADLPAAEKEQPAPRSGSVSKSEDGRSAQTPAKSELPTSDKPVRLASNAHDLKKASSTNQQMQNKVGTVKEILVNRPRPASTEPRKSTGGGVGNVPRQSTGSKALPNKVHSQNMGMNRPPGNVTNGPMFRKNPSTTKPPSTQNHYLEQKRVTQGSDKVKTTPKQPLSSSKDQPSKQISSHGTHHDRVKKQPTRRSLDDDEDNLDYRNLIQKMFRYDPSKYAGMDDDVDDMEVGFDSIQKEERRSAKIARREDEEEWLKIQEEEKAEQEAKMRKKQKLR